MKRYQSTLTKMTRPVCMALAALLMVGAMASCSENENTETALASVSLPAPETVPEPEKAIRKMRSQIMKVKLTQTQRATFTASRYGCFNLAQTKIPILSHIRKKH